MEKTKGKMTQPVQAVSALPHPHDHLAKFYFADPELFADFLSCYGDRELVPRLDLGKLRRLNPAVIKNDLTSRIGDFRYLCEFKNSRLPLEAFIFLEHQSSPQHHIALRILRYISDAYDNFLNQPKRGKKPPLLPYPLAIVLYHGKMPWKGPLALREMIGVPPGVNPFILDFPLRLVDVARMRPGQLKGSLVLQALLEALRSTAHGELEQRLPDIMGKLAASKKNPLLRDRMDAMCHYAVNFCRSPKSIEVVSSSYGQAFSRKEGDQMAKTLVEQWLEEGMEKGMEKGREEGREEARNKAVNTLLTILAARFGKIPAQLEKRLRKLADLDELGRLAVLAATCESLSEFKQAATDMKVAAKK